MAAKHTRLELTWIGKDERPRLEPRILLEDPELSYHAEKRVSNEDIFDNLLIHGDNLLALKALQHEYAGRIKCVFIDPPYNTGSAFEHYADGLEHSLWLSLMRERLAQLHKLLCEEGSLWITIDDNECHYLKVICDEIFGRDNFVASCAWEKDKGGRGDADISRSHDHILVFAKDRQSWSKARNLLGRTSTQLNRFKNPDNDPRGPWRQGDDGTAKSGSEKQRFEVVLPSGRRVRPPDGRYWAFSSDTLERARLEGRAYFGKDGDRLPIIKRYLSEVRVGVAPRTWWPADEVGTNQAAKRDHLNRLLSGIQPFDTPKPETLLSRILEISTNPGDIVLDSFAGSGTTGAVAHKMGRRWIMVELGNHCYTHICPRLRKVIDGLDDGGISQSRDVIWQVKLGSSLLRNRRKLLEVFDECSAIEQAQQGSYQKIDRVVEAGSLVLYGCNPKSDGPLGGGFRFFTMAPSLLEQDKWSNWVVSKQYNPEMLAEAMCKLEGFRYAPDPDVFWIHGQSTETDLIYVTTQNLSQEQLQFISDQVGDERTLLICCSAFRAKPDAFANLTLKKIPQAVLHRCEWGRDDYSLNVNALPDPEPEPDQDNEESAESMASAEDTSDAVTPRPATRRGRPRRRSSTMQELPLFANLDQGGDA